MTSWRIASDDGSSRVWHSSALEDDERGTKLPIKVGDQIRDTAFIWDVTRVKRHHDGSFELKLKRDDGGDTAITTLKCRMVVDLIDEEKKSR
jgi:hypothetical protein